MSLAHTLAGNLEHGIHAAASVLSFRGLPVVGYLLLQRTASIGTKIGVGIAFAALLAVLQPWSTADAFVRALVYAYFALAACALPRLVAGLRARRITAGVAFTLCAGAFFAVPLIALPLGKTRPQALVLGWDMMLAAYSYCSDVSRTAAPARLRDGLFFMLVNPALVYARRGRQVGGPALNLRAFGRAALGFLTLAAAAAVIQPFSAVVSARSTTLAPESARLMAIAPGLFAFIGVYAQQSGLASLQIGLLRLAGHEIPERFEWPILARDPLDFWRRWNTYVGGWLLRYVFWPFAMRYANARADARRRLMQALSVILTFAVAGVLHDAYAYALDFTLTARATLAFVASGLIVTLWAGVRQFWTQTSRASREPRWFSAVRVPVLLLLWLPILSFFTPASSLVQR